MRLPDGLRPESARKFYFCFTLDTEPDDLWANAPTNTFDHFARLLDFHKDLVDAGARPAFLTTSEVVEDVGARRVMQQIVAHGNPEIGAHFHSWTRKWPFEVPDLGVPPIHACAHRLGQSLEERMLDYTCRALESALGSRPVSYRGGRWSLNGESLTSLRNCGIKVDTTVTPGISWADGRHPWLSAPDYRAASRRPYYMGGNSLDPQDHGDILELPVGASFIPDRATALSGKLRHRITRRLWRFLGNASGLVWLRPTVQTPVQMRECLRLLRRDNIPVWVAMIHSSEIAPCTVLPSEREVRSFRQRCISLVRDAIELGAHPATLHEVWQLCGSYA